MFDRDEVTTGLSIAIVGWLVAGWDVDIGRPITLMTNPFIRSDNTFSQISHYSILIQPNTTNQKKKSLSSAEAELYLSHAANEVLREICLVVEEGPLPL